MNLLDIFQTSEDLAKYPAGTVLFSEGSAGSHMYVVMEGEVEISLHEKRLAIAGPGDMVGEMALIDTELRSATATTRTDCVLAIIDRTSFESMLRHVPEFSMHVMTSLTQRIKYAVEQVD